MHLYNGKAFGALPPLPNNLKSNPPRSYVQTDNTSLSVEYTLYDSLDRKYPEGANP